MSKAECGRLGGIKTSRKYGNTYMREIGLRGARAFHKKYMLVPVRTNDFLIVNRISGVAVNSICGILTHK
jgi:hypothetical protein